MNDNKTYLTICGKTVTGWLATLIVILMLGCIIGSGFYAGWRSGIRHVCNGESV